MQNPKKEPPRWIANLRTLMAARSLNPRSLSLKAGLNPTAVRDMLEGRTKFPRYDTAQALARALDVTPAQLMGGEVEKGGNPPVSDDNLELLTEIIARLQEVAEERRHAVAPRDFAAMVTTIYRQMQEQKDRKKAMSALKPKISDLLDYESFRRRAVR